MNRLCITHVTAADRPFYQDRKVVDLGMTRYKAVVHRR